MTTRSFSKSVIAALVFNHLVAAPENYNIWQYLFILVLINHAFSEKD